MVQLELNKREAEIIGVFLDYIGLPIDMCLSDVELHYGKWLSMDTTNISKNELYDVLMKLREEG